jgi:hypothetical protein
MTGDIVPIASTHIPPKTSNKLVACDIAFINTTTNNRNKELNNRAKRIALRQMSKASNIKIENLSPEEKKKYDEKYNLAKNRLTDMLRNAKTVNEIPKVSTKKFEEEEVKENLYTEINTEGKEGTRGKEVQENIYAEINTSSQPEENPYGTTSNLSSHYTEKHVESHPNLLRSVSLLRRNSQLPEELKKRLLESIEIGKERLETSIAEIKSKKKISNNNNKNLKELEMQLKQLQI